MESNRKRLNQLQEKLKGITRKSLNRINHVSNKYKKAIGTSFCLATILTTSIHNSSVSAQEIPELGVETIYHVYVDGNHIGSIDNRQMIDDEVKSKLNEYREDYSDMDLVIGEDLKLIPEVVFNSSVNNNSALRELKNKLTVKVKAIALEVDGKEIAYVRSEEDYQAVVKKLKLQYVSEKELAAVQKVKEEKKTPAAIKIGEKVVQDVKLTKDIELKKVDVTPNQILSVKDSVKQLNLGTLEDEIYKVQPGDVLGTIAESHGLPIQEILELNPSITEDTLLQIGDQLNVTVYKPIVKVIVNEKSKVKEEIPFQTEIKENPNMLRGDTKVKQAGHPGEKVVSYNITRENGRTIKKEIVSKKIVKEAENRIVIKGTKVTPSRGTGRLAWPAAGGYISSYQGMRWGRFHKGIDIARPRNLNILAADNGTVTFAGWDGGYGNKVMINHNNGMSTVYGHLSSIDVRVGQIVAQGQSIGVMGSTGNSTGIHLHFEVYQNGKLNNPMGYLNR